MGNITQEQIINTIKDCKWKNDSMGVDVCRGQISPCDVVIASGRCDALTRLLSDANVSGNRTCGRTYGGRQ